ncbi:phosphoglycerate dehydrogenase [Magnetococcales bacterium HHB-1]
MPRVLISDKMSPRAEEIFKEKGIDVDYKPGMTPEELMGVIGQYDGLAIRSATKVTSEILQAASNLKVVGRAGIGVDNVDIPTASQKGVIVMNTPFGNTITTAEHAVALAMAAARHLGMATESTKKGLWEKSRFMGKELNGKVAGVLGVGNIGALVVERLQGLKMKVAAFDPFISRKRAEELGVTLVEKLEDFWPMIDLLSVHTPLTPKTRHLVNKEAFDQMKDGVIIVHAARGGVVKEDDLYDALKSGKVFSAGVDVYESEPARENKLFELDNVVLTPHLGASTTEAQVNVAVQVASQIADYLLTGTIQNALNIPSVAESDMPKLRPFLNLGEKLGMTLGQLTEAGVKRIKVHYTGEVTGLNTQPITTTIVKSILAPMLDTVVNLVNAPLIAKERGIDIEESSSTASGVFSSQIQVTLTTERRERCLSGALFMGEEPRLVSMNKIAVEAQPIGNVLVIVNQDVPGMIGRIGGVLGNAEINIAGFQLGRQAPDERAIALVNIDQEASREVMDQLRAIPNVIEVKQVRY